jgi:hypothetical protein
MYRNYKSAYLFEVVTGLLCLIVISLVGEKGIILIALIAVRPFVLEKTTVVLASIEKYYSIGKAGIYITFLSLLIYYLSTEYIFQSGTDWKKITLLISPYFLLSHGLAGLFYDVIKK